MTGSTHPSIGHAGDRASLPVVILCGGKGTRLQEETVVTPKPMVSIGGFPILWHIMRYFSAYEFHQFVLCLGYKAEVIKQFALDYRYISKSFVVNTQSGVAKITDNVDNTAWEISCVDTGLDAMTGARLSRIRRYVGDSTFFLTYGDGVANVDLDQLLAFHQSHGRAVTVTAVHPPSRFGSLELEGGRVKRFAEKDRGSNDYINGGFFVCSPKVFDYVSDDSACAFERTPLEQLAKDGELMAYRHDDFWQCMDTMRDREVLEDLWAAGAPWKIW